MKLDTRQAWAIIDESGLRLGLFDTRKEATAMAPKGATVKQVEIVQGYTVTQDRDGAHVIGPVASLKLAESEVKRLEEEAREHAAEGLNPQRIPDASNPGEFFEVPPESVGIHPMPPHTYTVQTVDMPDDWSPDA